MRRYVSYYPNRTVCSVLEEMRQSYKTYNFANIKGLIEEAQTLANRMEAALEDNRDIKDAREVIKELKEEIEELEKKKKKGGTKPNFKEIIDGCGSIHDQVKQLEDWYADL